MKTDPEFHEYWRDFPVALPLLSGARRPPGRLTTRSLTFKRSEWRIDDVVHPEEPGGWYHVVESVGYLDPEAERHLVLKATLLAEQEGAWNRIRMTAVYLTRQIADAALPAGLGPDGGPRITRIVLSEISPEDLLARGPELFPLIPLGAIGREELEREFGAFWREVAARREVDEEMKAKLLANFLRFYSARWEGSRLIDAKRFLEVVMPIEETGIGRDLIEIGERRGVEQGRKEGRRKGREEGRRKGREEGRRKGREEGLLLAIRAVLVTRFGEAPEDLERVLARKDVESLQRALELALRARSVKVLRQRLGDG